MRVVINELVCEGCGDCSVKSNCLSVEPLETEFGRKRTINQSTCNKDMSCLKGFCPSFVTVEGGQLKKKSKSKGASPLELGALPEPALPALATARSGASWWPASAAPASSPSASCSAWPAHIEGKGIVTQDAAGLAQKGGATWSHVLIGDTPGRHPHHPRRHGRRPTWSRLRPVWSAVKPKPWRACARDARTSRSTRTARRPRPLCTNANWANPQDACASEIARAVGADAVGAFDADAAATALMGDSIYANPMLLGFAWQKGWIPLGHESLMRAIELNAVAVENNKTAFEWGRQAAHDRPRCRSAVQPGQVIEFKKRETRREPGGPPRRIPDGYQNAAYAGEYQDFVEQGAAGRSRRWARPA